MQDSKQRNVIKSNEKQNLKHASYEPYTSKELVPVGFASQPGEPTDQEIYDMVDSVIGQVLGSKGLAAIIKPGDKVIIKVNIIATGAGSRGEKNRGGITDPRIVRYVAEKVRSIIGFSGPADLKVVDTTFYKDKNPSLKEASSSFYWARLERTDDNAVQGGDICYDSNGDGILDGGSYAKLVNLDSIDEEGRFTTKVKVASGDEMIVSMPKFLRTRKEAKAEGSDEYCDVLIGLPVMKSHGLCGITGAIKLGYGFRYCECIDGDTGRWLHNGLYMDEKGIHNRLHLFDYLCSQNIVRKYDLVIMDCLTGNRIGPSNPYGNIASNFNANKPIDYILTHAVLASKDSVAIDTVESVLGGYNPKSIKLLQTGFENGLGTNNPKYINVQGLNNFYDHRKYLYETYPREKYPFQNGWGGAEILPSNDILFNIFLEEPVEIKYGVFAVKYNISTSCDDVIPQLSRVELWVNNSFMDYRNEGDLLKGRFIIDIEKEHLPKNSSTACFITAWDNIFNCLISREIIFKS